MYSEVWRDEIVIRIFFVEALCGLHKKVMPAQWLAADKRVPAEVEVVQVILARVVAVYGSPSTAEAPSPYHRREGVTAASRQDHQDRASGHQTAKPH